VRLLWAAWRSGQRARRVSEVVELPDDLAVGSGAPRVPYGHPDLLLGRAVAARIITADEADLIGDTRLGDVLVDQLAEQQGLSAPVLRMRRHRAEQKLVAALARGSVGDVVLDAAPRRAPSLQARRDGVALAPHERESALPRDKRPGAGSR
jgi:hypothetical protein